MRASQEITAQQIADAQKLSVNTIRRRAEKESWPFRPGVKKKGGGIVRLYSLASLPSDIQNNLPAPALTPAPAPTRPAPTVSAQDDLPAWAEEIAHRRFSFVVFFLAAKADAAERGEKKGTAAEAFISGYNEGLLHPALLEKLGRVSISTASRWEQTVRGKDYRALAPIWGKHRKDTTVLTAAEKERFEAEILNDKRIKIDTAVHNVKVILNYEGVESPSGLGAFRAYAKKIEKRMGHVWTLMREGEKALTDKVLPSISLDLPDIRNTNTPLKKIDAIAQSCVEELKSYSRAKAKTEDGDIPLEALAQLPADMCAAVSSKAADSLRAWLSQTVEGNFASIAIADVFEKTGVDFGGKPTAAKVRKVASVLNFAGYSIEPHPDFGGKCDAGQDVVIFKNQGISEAPASEAYLGVAHMLALSVAVANADGEILADEKKHLREMTTLEGRWLSPPEQNRLASHLEWLMAYPPTWAALQSKLKKLSLEGRRLMARFALATAATDGRIDPGEVKLLKKLYTLMEVDKNRLYADLHAFGGGPMDQPVSVRAAEPKTDFTIPAKAKPAPATGGAIILDMSRVEQVRQETHEISQMLSEVFADPEAEAEQIPEMDVSVEEESEAFSGLDTDHSLLLDELLAREHWPREDYERLCKEFGLMAEGALETINDWAFDTHDDAVIGDGDTLVINKKLLQGDSA